MPAILGSIISGGASLASDYFGNKSTNKQNRLSEQYADRTYNKERKDALTDWHRQNDYNDPASAMKRLQAAGLNKNLVAGASSGGGQASPVKSVDTQSGQFRESKFEGLKQAGGAVGNFYDTKIKQAQVDNLKTQNTVNMETAALKKAQTLNTLTQNNTGKFDLGLKSQLRTISADAAAERLRQITANTESTIQTRRYQGVNQDINYKQKEETIKGTTLSNEIKSFEVQLNKMGIQKGGNLYDRLMSVIYTSGKAHEKHFRKYSK